MQCRLCLNECQEKYGVPLFGANEESDLIKLIAKHLFIEVSQLDTFSKMICEDCFVRLNEFHKFFEYVVTQQKLLQNVFLESLTVEEKPINFTTELELNDESMLDIKDVVIDNHCLEEPLATVEFGFADDCEPRLSFEAESEEDMPLQSLINTVKPEPLQSQPTKKVNSKQKEKKLYCTRRKARRKYGSMKPKVQDKPKKEVFENDKSEKTKSYLSPEENKLRDEMVTKYVDMKCDICSARVESYDSLKMHFRKEHNRKAYIMCCNTRFLRRFLLLDHIKSHLNPEHFKCNLCHKVLKSQNSLNIHMKNKHVDRDELKHACNLCNKKFQHRSSLNHHMFVHKKERDHICDICQKGFKSNVLLKGHIQHMHGERATFVCETCGKEYRFKLSFDRHVAEHQGRITTDPSDKCSVCGKWYTLKNLKKHIKRHELEDSKCAECGKTFKSKSALATHISYAHNKKVYSCTLCEKTFKRPSALKEHIAMHTGRKDYNCAHCPREFRSKANMYSHIKKVHVEEWKLAQMTRYQCPNTDLKKDQK